MTKIDHNFDRSALLVGDAVRSGDDNSLSFPLSSEQPYRRYDGKEILDHSKDAVDLSFLNNGSAPLLDSHDRWSGLKSQLGVITKAWIEKKRLWVTVKFSSRQDAQDVKQDIEDGILRNVSVGYSVLATDKSSRDEDDDEYRVTKWKPIEASIVSIPADETVGVGRSTQPKEGTMPDKHKAQASSGDDARDAQVMPGMEPAMTDEQRGQAIEDATNEITTLAKEHNMGDIASQFLKGAAQRGEIPNVAAFKGWVRAELPADTPLRNEDIGLTARETQQFSVLRYLNATLVDNPTSEAREAAAFELEVARAVGEGRNGGIVLPAELMRHWNDYRDPDGNLSVNMTRAAMSTGGHANVQSTAHLAGRFFEALRDRLVVGSLGATFFTGLEGNIEFPGQDTVITAAWLASEDANAAESTPTYRKVEMEIHDVATYTDITRRMLIQSTIDVEMDVRAQIVNAMATEIDRVAFYGSGASGQPTGIANTAGIGSVDFGTAPIESPTRDQMIDMRALIAGTNKVGKPVFVGNSTMAADLMKTKVDAGSGKFLMDAATERLDVGNRFEETNMISDGDIFAGVFDDLIMGTWGTLELDRSTEAKFLSAGLRLRAIQSVDFGLRRVGSFVLGNDGGS